jgi:hypothetical protein
MRLTRCVIGCLALALVAAADEPAPQREPPDASRLRPGMDPAEARQVLGAPFRVARQILYHRYLEQWAYETPGAPRVEFDCSRGQAPRLTSVRTSDTDNHP